MPTMSKAGLKRNALYLVRPDGYIGLVDGGSHASAIGAYLDGRKIKLP
jgi:hypothetical protein